MFKDFIIIIFLIWGIVMSVLYANEKENRELYKKSLESDYQKKVTELQDRESKVLEKEVCMSELKKMKTVQNSIMEMLSK